MAARSLVRARALVSARSLLVVVALAGLFLLGPAMLAPLFLAIGPSILVAFAAGCLALAVAI